MTTWTKGSWKNHPISQQVNWPDAGKRDEVLNQISKLPALVFAGETRSLKSQLADVSSGKSFILQGGDCAEEFSHCHGPRIHNLIKVILQMSTVLSYAGGKRLINIGRMAGQYAKPRSSETETIDGVEIPAYRGDIINSSEPIAEARIPNPNRMLDGYFRSAATLNLVRAFTTGGYASLENLNEWHKDYVSMMPSNNKYKSLADEITRALKFLKVTGLNSHLPELNQQVFFSSHEALMLEYEEALTRIDTTTGLWYDTSAHFLWLGERTRRSDGAHVEFLSGIHNPIGVKISAHYQVDDLNRLIEKLNPKNEAGRLTFITRMGSEAVKEALPKLIRAMKKEGHQLVWVCDPMHGNTYKSADGRKTRSFKDIVQEIESFFQIHTAEGTIAGGVHLELTGESVTECVGGTRNLIEKDLFQNYQTTCDPRLNAEQGLELAFEIADLLKN